MPLPQTVENHDIVTAIGQRQHRMAADEARAAGDENPHQRAARRNRSALASD
jgi:hypothetical protein